MSLYDLENLVKETEKKLSEEKPEPEVKDPALEEVKEEIAAEAETAEPIEEISEDDPELLDPKKDKAWAHMRHEQKTLKEQVEKERVEKQELRERLAKLEGAHEARATPKIVEEDKEPDSTYDEANWLKWKSRQDDKKISNLNAKVDEVTKYAAIEQAKRELSTLETEYKEKNKVTDYKARLEFIRQKEATLIKLDYPNATEAQIKTHLDNEYLLRASKAATNGKNPAEIFIKMADAYGYAPSNPDIKKDIPIDKLNYNMKKNTNLMGSSNAGKTGPKTAEQLVGETLGDIMRNGDDLEKMITEARQRS